MKILNKSEMNVKSDECLYLFCITTKDALYANDIFGMYDIPVSLLGFNNLVLVFNKLPVAEWVGDLGEKNLSDIRWIGPKAVQHQEVIIHIMCHAPVLPAGFGTLFSTVEKLNNLIKKNYSKIKEFLSFVTNKEEWSVKGLIDLTQAEEDIFAKLTEKSNARLMPGVKYLMEQKRREDASKMLKNWRIKVEIDILEKLKPFFVDFQKLQNLEKNVSGRDKDMILNWVFLISKNKLEGFQKEIDVLSNEYAETGLLFEVSGTWPPYDFCPELENIE